MKSTTYTLLVTIEHDGAAPSANLLALHVQQGLEEGTREHKSHIAAGVDAFPGNHIKNAKQYATPAKSA